jgi:TonB family protein
MALILGDSSPSSEIHHLPEEVSSSSACLVSRSDFAELVAMLSAFSGGNLSKELSVGLVLDIVLNQIAEEARRATCATGAAIVLERDGELVCRASTGASVPELGARLDTGGGLWGACVKTRQMQRCDDAQSDPRANVEASRMLDIRSVMMLPLLWNDVLTGVFEVFSSRASAFGERDERALEGLAQQALKTLQQANETLSTRVVDVPEAPAEERYLAEPETQSRDESAAVYASGVARPNGDGQRDVLTFALGVVVLACAALLGAVIGLQLVRHQAVAEYTHKAKSGNRTTVAGTSAKSVQTVAASAAPSVASLAVATPPAGSLLIYRNGKEVFRRFPAAPGEKEDAHAGKLERTSSVSRNETEPRLLYLVEPDYPQEARRQRIQGPVVLDLNIGKDGVVQNVGFVSGPAFLADAATSAVKQWRFKVNYLEGHPVEMHTRITLRFILPTP